MDKGVSVTAIGDVCVDIYDDQGVMGPGGTAFNVAIQARKAGATTSIISAVGNDHLAQLPISVLRSDEINMQHLARMKGCTSTLRIRLDQSGKPSYSDWQLGALRDFSLTSIHERFLGQQHAARAVLYRPLRRVFEQFCAMRLPNTLKVGDFVSTSSYTYDIEIIRKYTDQLDILVRSIDHTDHRALQFLRTVAVDYNKIVLALLGEGGSIAFYGEANHYQQSTSVRVSNTTGAGDAYVAHFIVAYFENKNIPVAMERAARGAEEVIRQAQREGYRRIQG